MNKKKTALMLTAAISLTALASCGTAAPAATSAAPETTQATAQTTATTAAETTAEAETTTAAEQTGPVSGRTELNWTDEEFKEFIHKLFVENQQETMLERHTSQTVTYTNDFPLSENTFKHYYITSDISYAEAEDSIEYIKDRIEYRVYGLYTPDDTDVEITINLCKDYAESLWRYTPTDESEFIDYEHDHLESVFKEDGKLHILSRFDEYYNKFYCENQIGKEYEGEIITSETIVDEVSHDLLAIIFRNEQDGRSEIINTISFEYDNPEPVACAVVHAIFERASADKVTVCFVVDPDTEHEISKTAEIPANTFIKYDVDDMETVQVFDDRECTIPHTKHWDRMSDLTLYLKHISAE